MPIIKVPEKDETISHEHIGKTEHYTDFGPIRLMKSTGMCPKCETANSLLMNVDEFGVQGMICRNCGYERGIRARAREKI
jgi:Zn ribbon nucleic-acid-binding protein